VSFTGKELQMRSGRLVQAACVAFVLSGAGVFTAQNPPAGGDVTVTVTYKGKGVVDATHEILVFLFTDPKIDASSRPLSVRAVKQNGGVATFINVQVNPVYVVAVYDEKDNYDGTSGPPPAGTPISTYTGPTGKGVAAAVVPGPKGAIKMTFDDAKRWTP
jgi:hypothetical protein